MFAHVISIAVLILLSAFFSSAETAFTSLNMAKIKNLASEDVKSARLVIRLSDRYDKLLSTILIGNNIVNISAASIATVMFTKLYGEYGATVSTAVITVLVLIFGEVTPKIAAKDKDEELAMLSAPAVNVLMILFTPLTAFFSQWKKLVEKVIGKSEEPEYTQDELKTIVEEAKTGGGIGEAQSRLITNAIEFEELEAIDIITPRTDIIAVDIDMPVKDIGVIFKESGLSRLPVYDDDLDDIIGVLNQKDYHNYIVGEGRPLSEYVKPVAFVAESIKAAVLLKLMQQAKTHIAIMIDEYGGTTGLVTMEDIIEQLVGQIYDEYDAIEYRKITRQRDGSYKVAGGTNIEKFFQLVGENEDFEEATTVNGWVMVAQGRMPKVGDTFDYETRHKVFHVRVTKADARRALMTRIYIEDKPEEEE